MRLNLALFLTLPLMSLACITPPRHSWERSLTCVQHTFAYANMVRGVATIKHGVETDKDGVHTVAVYEQTPQVYRRLGAFRVQPNHAIEMWNVERNDWQNVGYCD